MSQQLPDVQASSPDVTVGLNRVGVTGVEKLVKLGRRDRDPIVLMAEFEVFVDLPATRKGADMSRNMEVIDETLETATSEPTYRVEDVCGDAADVLDAVRRLARRRHQRLGAAPHVAAPAGPIT